MIGDAHHNVILGTGYIQPRPWFQVKRRNAVRSLLKHKFAIVRRDIHDVALDIITLIVDKTSSY